VTIVGSVTLIAPDLNGAAVGVTAIGAAFVTESLILGLRLVHFSRKAGPLFAHEIYTNGDALQQRQPDSAVSPSTAGSVSPQRQSRPA
jgi:hypothetical protein